MSTNQVPKRGNLPSDNGIAGNGCRLMAAKDRISGFRHRYPRFAWFQQ
ncbi:MAG: hypothetical protein ACU836_00745 [Gammaproteobacteria bacterium]